MTIRYTISVTPTECAALREAVNDARRVSAARYNRALGYPQGAVDFWRQRNIALNELIELIDRAASRCS